MEVVEAIKARRSIRGFLPQSVPKSVLEDVLGIAARSPSGGNQQPWEVNVIGGEVMEQVKEALFQELKSRVTPDPEIWYPLPSELPELYQVRRQGMTSQLYAAVGIGRDDKEARMEWYLRGIKFFGAPNGLIFCQDSEMGALSLLDLGLFLQSIMLAALAFGLGTCPQIGVTQYPKILRRILDIPDGKKIICGMAIGYPDWEFPANNVQSPREPVEVFTRWHGF